jgi:uncharacterized membrane protein YkoI
MRKPIALLAAAALVASGLAAPAAAQRGRDAERSDQAAARSDQPAQRGRNAARSDQATARQQMQAGREISPREIERRIVPRMRGSDYLGFEYDPGGAYRFKFLKDGQVTWVDVDARTGRVLRVSR